MAKASSKSATPSAETEAAKCAVTREEFKAAKPFMASLNGIPVAVTPKEFKTGTLGWFANGKVSLDVNGTVVNASFMIQVFIPHSADAE